MRKALVIFLLAVLPFQFVWGAAAGYCQHEQGVEVSHLGHHTHKHAGKVTKASEMSAEKSQQAGSDDADCIACHMSAATVISRHTFGAACSPGHAGLADGSDFTFQATGVVDRPAQLGLADLI